MAVRIELSSLGEEVRRRLAAGETVEVEDHGKVVAEVAPRHDADGTLEDLLTILRTLPVDEDFFPDLRRIHEELNRPWDPPAWLLS
jgi:antitoxin (DNA-binding transcriptional repressor) of toxin-antitoxin stability system